MKCVEDFTQFVELLKSAVHEKKPESIILYDFETGVMVSAVIERFDTPSQ